VGGLCTEAPAPAAAPIQQSGHSSAAAARRAREKFTDARERWKNKVAKSAMIRQGHKCLAGI
jgi:hypothetical protein